LVLAGHQLLGSAVSSVGGWQGRSRAAGCLLDLPALGLFGAASDLGSSSSMNRMHDATGHRSHLQDLNCKQQLGSVMHLKLTNMTQHVHKESCTAAAAAVMHPPWDDFPYVK
jgi:hypothetical protein